jgi:ubiquitin C-terminal hydrolase
MKNNSFQQYRKCQQLLKKCLTIQYKESSSSSNLYRNYLIQLGLVGVVGGAIAAAVAASSTGATSSTGAASYRMHANTFTKSIKKIKGFSWIGNSCYIDSVLMCLLLNKNKIISQHILKKKIELSETGSTICNEDPMENFKIKNEIQKMLVKITLSIRGKNDIKNCSNFRKLLKNCSNENLFHLEGIQDAADFLNYILGIFPIDVATEESITTENSPGFEESVRQTSRPHSVIIPAFLNVMDKNKDISQFLIEEDTQTFERKDNKHSIEVTRQTKKMYTSPLIIFNINRKLDDTILHTKVIAPPIILSNLNLIGIVVHLGIHYTSYVIYKKNWYYYDDTKEERWIHVGSYEDMIQSQPNPLTHGTLFFYF